MLYNVFLCLLAASASCVVGQGSVACTDGRPEVLTTEGNFSSPNYPENYPANSLCEWHIVAPEGKLVHIEVTSLELAVCCECDYLELIDGDTAAGVQYGHWYENDVPPALTSRTNNVYARFRSDPTAHYAGFNLVYTFV